MYSFRKRMYASRSGRPEARAWTNLQQQCQSHRQNWCVIWMNGNASPCQFELPPRNYLPLRFQRTCTFSRFIRKDIGANQRITIIKKFYSSVYTFLNSGLIRKYIKYVILVLLTLQHKTLFFKKIGITIYYLYTTYILRTLTVLFCYNNK